MPDVKIRNLPDWVVGAHKSRAARAGRSLEEQLRILLTEAASKPREQSIRRVVALREKLRRKYGQLSDSVAAIREDREARG